MSSTKISILAGEANAGISISNIFIAIGTGVLGLCISYAPKSNLPIILMFGGFVFLAAIYSSICYANVHGSLRKSNATWEDSIRPIYWGNAISEYWCVYIINPLLPCLVWAYSNDDFSTRIVYTVVAVTFFTYNSTRFDLLERIAPSMILRLCMTAIYLFFVIAFIESVIAGFNYAFYLALIVPVFSFILSAIHIYKSEKH